MSGVRCALHHFLIYVEVHRIIHIKMLKIKTKRKRKTNPQGKSDHTKKADVKKLMELMITL